MDAMWSASTVKVIGSGIDDPDFADKLSRLIGDHDVETTSTSHSESGKSTSVSMRQERILPADAIRALPKGTALCFATGMRAAMLDLRPWYREPGLECLASVVVASSLAGNDLAGALYANPYEGAPFPGYSADSASVRTARHAEAIPKMTGHLTDAAHQLDLSAIGCHYVATAITRDLTSTREAAATAQRAAGPALTGTQYDALKSFSLGSGRLYEGSQRGAGAPRVATGNGTRVSIATFRALAKRGLVDRDTSTSLFHGQKITVTKEGQQALSGPRPAVTATPPATKAAPKASAVQGAHR